MIDHSDTGAPTITIAEAKRLLTIISSRITESGKQAIMLWGPPGIGKSDLVRELATETDRKFVDIRLSTIDPVDLRGLPHIDHNQSLTRWLPPDFLPNEQSDSGILFLDEINAASPSIQASAYQLILDRKLGNYAVPTDWIIIAAGNRISDRAVTYRLPSALANRFTHLEIIVNANEWVTWAWKENIDPLVISFIRHHPSLLLQFDPEKQSVAFPTPRSWAFVSSFQDVRDIDLALYLKGIQGTIGISAAQQFLAFLKHRDSLPDPSVVLSGEEYDYPSSPDAQFIMMGSLINEMLRETTVERITNFFRYVNHFSNSSASDHAVLLVKELVVALNSAKPFNQNASSLLGEHPEFKKWVENNKEVLQ